MKERPILFSAPMVRATLGGSKTQTRRIVKPQPDIVSNSGKLAVAYTPDDERLGRLGKNIPCPYGLLGNRLWVRETWRTDASLNDKAPHCFAGWPVRYEADGTVLKHGAFYGLIDGKTRVSIHMPRWASRIQLDIVGVRVERLQDISEADAKAEGCQVPSIIYPDEPRNSYCYAEQFRLLWESLNGPGSWDANPWVWVIEFRRI